MSYEVSGLGAVTRRIDDGAVTSYSFVGERLVSESGPSGSLSFVYDDSAAGLGLLSEVRSAGGGVVQSFSYDVFERLVGSDGVAVGDELSVSYDALDRRSRVTDPSGTRSLAYVGLSQRLSREQDPAGAGGFSRWFDWDSELSSPYGRTVQTNVGESYRSFGLDANGSVERLEQSGGLVAPNETYRYDPYGRLESQSLTPPLPGQPAGDPEAELSGEARENRVRFQGFAFEPGAGVYDMHARAYHPRTGRFLSQDRYQHAFADLRLRTDPLTQDRYAFAGGNPVGRVEWDGHYAGNEGGAQRAMRGSRTPRGRRGGRRRRAEAQPLG